MAMTNPPHPGRSIRENCLDPLGLNVTEAARVLGVARHTLSRVLNGRAAISPEMAIRLEKAGWSNAGFLAAQAGHLRSGPGAEAGTRDQGGPLVVSVRGNQNVGVKQVEEVRSRTRGLARSE